MRKKRPVLFSILTIIGTAVLAAGATWAYFTVTRTAETNTFEVGTLDLNVESGGEVNKAFVLENLGENSNLTGSQTWTIRNDGTLNGRLLVRLLNLDNQENGCNDPEEAAEPNCTSDTVGELGGLVTLRVLLDGEEQVSSTLANADVTNIGEAWNALDPIVIVEPNETVDVTLEWDLDETAYGNEIQSDSLTFDTNFRLIQEITGPTPTN